jgi:hypothetical protein
MPGPLLTTASTIMCPHGGMAVLKTSNSSTSAGARVLLESDEHEVRGCPFTVPGQYRPCKSIKWSAGPHKVTVNGKKVLVRTSVGICRSEDKIVQGIAVIMQTQLKATAL